MNVHLIVNRRARHLGDGSALRETLVGSAVRFGAGVHETGSLEELDAVVRELGTRGSDVVVLAGGDGSHMAGLSALSRAFGGRLPPVALAPGGTVNTIARNLGMGGHARAWAERVMNAAADPRTPRRDVPSLRVRDDRAGDRVGCIFGTGLVARFFDVYEAAPRQGIGPAAALAGRVLAGSVSRGALARRVLEPMACTVEVDGAPQASRAWTLVLASVLRDVGLGVRATYRAGEAFDRFHVVASKLPARGLAAQVPHVLTGRPMRGEGHVDVLARSLAVRFESPAAYVLDGDVVAAGAAFVEAGPVVTLLVP